MLFNKEMDIKEIRRQHLLRSISQFGSIEALADRTGANSKHVSQLKNGTRNIGDRFARKMEAALGLSVGDWDKSPLSVAEPSGEYSAGKMDSISIPRLDVAGSMGFGAAAPAGHIDVVERITVNMEYLRRNLAISSPANLAMITGYGDSMEGTFNDGDLLLVDRGVTEIKVDAVYVLCLGDELYIKRIQRRPGGSFLMLSDNVKYPPYEITNSEADNFQVLGRVLLAWNARKL
ncbi:LexA family transcriptional regulator [Gilvimarinus chinensis]|uniref:LexA family transcriptional regulator n=1 Tax=Gilvimarinus chinensis TaxID=396005 RepID=UPI00037338AC|nr:LexA family transcriptional regulator [Gilvimarinus chinensis]